jgi:hypothetical protein
MEWKAGTVLKKYQQFKDEEDRKTQDPNLTFKPEIGNVQLRSDLSSNEKIKRVPGMTKFLEKQFVAMCNKEELALKHHNMGRSRDNQLTIEQWIDSNYAYASEINPNTDMYLKARQASLNPNLSGPVSKSPTRNRAQPTQQRF